MKESEKNKKHAVSFEKADTIEIISEKKIFERSQTERCHIEEEYPSPMQKVSFTDNPLNTENSDNLTFTLMSQRDRLNSMIDSKVLKRKGYNILNIVLKKLQYICTLFYI